MSGLGFTLDKLFCLSVCFSFSFAQSRRSQHCNDTIITVKKIPADSVLQSVCDNYSAHKLLVFHLFFNLMTQICCKCKNIFFLERYLEKKKKMRYTGNFVLLAFFVLWYLKSVSGLDLNTLQSCQCPGLVWTDLVHLVSQNLGVHGLFQKTN